MVHPYLIDNRIARYRAWLNREPVERPMLGLLWEPDIPPLPEMMDQVGMGSLQPESIQPEMFLPYIEDWYEQESELQSDGIQPFTPAFGVPWVEALAGCPVSVRPGSLWAEPYLSDIRKRAPLRFDPENPWLLKLVEFTVAMVEASKGRYPIALPQMRGPLDCLAAMRGPDRMCIDLVESPDQVSAILDELTEIWIGVAEAVLAVIPPFWGGYCSRMKMWAPGRTVTPQNDVSTLISPEMYKRYVLTHDRRIVAQFPYHCFHMHSTEYHQIDNLLGMEKLTSIQLTLEHTLGGPSLEITLPAARRILSKKPLLLAALDVDTAERCVAELPHEGLCVTVATSEPKIPAEFEAWLRERCTP